MNFLSYTEDIQNIGIIYESNVPTIYTYILHKNTYIYEYNVHIYYILLFPVSNVLILLESVLMIVINPSMYI